ncbi:glycosyltransferase family 2 protein [Desulfogranum japonicum]|uniref:glycosyltransferase family 2 protein n=1 Tax=Desulfogranum japonicum TaxID=231447 RepID=UPI0003FE2B52|nr:glycosyltransferase family 2 protein [Desulfogranum japonicum]
MQENQNSISVTVLLPAFNEELSIGNTIRKIKELYPDFEVLVIDDGSTDQTMNVAMEAGADVCPHPYNIGNGAAIKTGIRCANGEWIIMMDADGQHDPDDIARLLEYKDTHDMIVGARNSEGQASMLRNFANKIYNNLASYVTKFKVEDLTSGFRLVKTETARDFVYLLPNTFSYPSTLTIAYLRSGRSIKYLPIKISKRQGKSKIKLFQDGMRFFLIITKIATLFSPLRIFLPVSLFFFIMGMGHYVYTFFTLHRFTNMSALLLSTSAIVFMMGLVSEQVTQIRYERTT